MTKKRKTPKPSNQNSTQKPVKSIQSVAVSSGPLPSPNILAEYDRQVPGAADRIIYMAEKEQQHRHEQESRVNEANINALGNENKKILRGQLMAYSIAVVGILATPILIYSGKTVEGSLFGGAVFTVLTTAFLYNKNDKKTNKNS